MSETAFLRLEDALLHDAFPDVDLALRRGRHIDRDDGEWFGFLVDAEHHLEAFYRRFGCELIRKSDGYFYLLPTSDKLGKRQLSLAEMLVGQALTLLYLDPATVERGGTVSKADVLSHLSSVVGTDALIRMLNPKRRRYDERVAHETVRSRVAEALRRLSTLGFVDIFDEERVRLRPALLRFAEPVRNSAAPSEALEQLVKAGEVVLADDDAEDTPDFESDTDADDAADTSAEEVAEPTPAAGPPVFELPELPDVPGAVTLTREEVESAEAEEPASDEDAPDELSSDEPDPEDLSPIERALLESDEEPS